MNTYLILKYLVLFAPIISIIILILFLMFLASPPKDSLPSAIGGVNESKRIQPINKPRRVSSLPMHTFSNLKTPGWNWGRVYT